MTELGEELVDNADELASLLKEQIKDIGNMVLSPKILSLPSKWNFTGAEAHNRNEDSFVFHYQVVSGLNDISAVPGSVNQFGLRGLNRYLFNINDTSVMTKASGFIPENVLQSSEIHCVLEPTNSLVSFEIDVYPPLIYDAVLRSKSSNYSYVYQNTAKIIQKLQSNSISNNTTNYSLQYFQPGAPPASRVIAQVLAQTPIGGYLPTKEFVQNTINDDIVRNTVTLPAQRDWVGTINMTVFDTSTTKNGSLSTILLQEVNNLLQSAVQESNIPINIMATELAINEQNPSLVNASIFISPNASNYDLTADKIRSAFSQFNFTNSNLYFDDSGLYTQPAGTVFGLPILGKMRLSGLNPEEIHEIMRQPEINKTNTMRKELMTAVYNATQASARPIVDVDLVDLQYFESNKNWTNYVYVHFQIQLKNNTSPYDVAVDENKFSEVIQSANFSLSSARIDQPRVYNGRGKIRLNNDSQSFVYSNTLNELQRIINNTQGNQILLRSEVENLQISNEIDQNNDFNFTFNIKTSKYNAIGPFDLQNELNQIHQMLTFNHSLIINNTIEIYFTLPDIPLPIIIYNGELAFKPIIQGFNRINVFRNPNSSDYISTKSTIQPLLNLAYNSWPVNTEVQYFAPHSSDKITAQFLVSTNITNPVFLENIVKSFANASSQVFEIDQNSVRIPTTRWFYCEAFVSNLTEKEKTDFANLSPTVPTLVSLAETLQTGWNKFIKPRSNFSNSSDLITSMKPINNFLDETGKVKIYFNLTTVPGDQHGPFQLTKRVREVLNQNPNLNSPVELDVATMNITTYVEPPPLPIKTYTGNFSFPELPSTINRIEISIVNGTQEGVGLLRSINAILEAAFLPISTDYTINHAAQYFSPYLVNGITAHYVVSTNYDDIGGLVSALRRIANSTSTSYPFSPSTVHIPSRRHFFYVFFMTVSNSSHADRLENKESEMYSAFADYITDEINKTSSYFEDSKLDKIEKTGNMTLRVVINVTLEAFDTRGPFELTDLVREELNNLESYPLEDFNEVLTRRVENNETWNVAAYINATTLNVTTYVEPLHLETVSYIGYVTFTGPNDPQAISDILSNNGKEISNKTNSYFSLALFNILRKMNPLGVDVQYYQPGYGPNATVHFKVTFPAKNNSEKAETALQAWEVDPPIDDPPVVVHPSTAKLNPFIIREFVGKINLTTPLNQTTETLENYANLFNVAINGNEKNLIVTVMTDRFIPILNNTQTEAKVWINGSPGEDVVPDDLTDRIRKFIAINNGFLNSEASIVIPRPPPDRLHVAILKIFGIPLIPNVVDLYPQINNRTFERYSQLAVQAISSAFSPITTWKPKVEYFQQKRDGSVLAHMVTFQPYNDFNTVSGVQSSINEDPMKASNIGNITFGEPREYLGSADFSVDPLPENLTIALINKLQEVFPEQEKTDFNVTTLNEESGLYRVNFTMFTRMNSPMLASQFQQKGREYFNNNPNPSNPSPGTLFYQADSLHVRVPGPYLPTTPYIGHTAQVFLYNISLPDVIDFYPTINETTFSRFSSKVLNISLSAQPSLASWNPEVEYFQQLPNNSVLAQMYFEQPFNSNFTTTYVENQFNNYMKKPNDIGNITFGGTRNFIGWLLAPLEPRSHKDLDDFQEKVKNELKDLLGPYAFNITSVEPASGSQVRLNYSFTTNPNQHALAPTLQDMARRKDDVQGTNLIEPKRITVRVPGPYLPIEQVYRPLLTGSYMIYNLSFANVSDMWFNVSSPAGQSALEPLKTLAFYFPYKIELDYFEPITSYSVAAHYHITDNPFRSTRRSLQLSKIKQALVGAQIAANISLPDLKLGVKRKFFGNFRGFNQLTNSSFIQEMQNVYLNSSKPALLTVEETPPYVPWMNQIDELFEIARVLFKKPSESIPIENYRLQNYSLVMPENVNSIPLTLYGMFFNYTDSLRLDQKQIIDQTFRVYVRPPDIPPKTTTFPGVSFIRFDGLEPNSTIPNQVKQAVEEALEKNNITGTVEQPIIIKPTNSVKPENKDVVKIPFNLTVDKDDLPPNKTNVETEKDLQKKINNIFNDIPKVPDLEGGEIIPQKTYIGVYNPCLDLLRENCSVNAVCIGNTTFNNFTCICKAGYFDLVPSDPGRVCVRREAATGDTLVLILIILACLMFLVILVLVYLVYKKVTGQGKYSPSQQQMAQQVM